MESEEVDRHVGAEIVVEPAAQFSCFVKIIANLRYNKICDLDVGLASVPYLLYRLVNRFRVRYSDMFSDKVRFSTAFEINGYAVEKIIHHRNSVGRIESIRDKYVDKPVFTCLDPDVARELHENSGLVVSVRNPLTPMAQRQADHVRRHKIGSFHFPSLTDVKVLAVATVVKNYAVSNVVVVGDTFEAVYRLKMLGRLCAFYFDPCSLV